LSFVGKVSRKGRKGVTVPRKPRGIAEKRAVKPRPKAAGQEIIYIVCPLCGRSRTLELSASTIERKPGKSKRLRWDFFDPETSNLVQIRIGGGKIISELGEMKFRGRGSARGAGFRLKEGLTWKEASANDEFQDQLEAIREQVKRLLHLIS